jgi:hypothetical protein
MDALFSVILLLVFFLPFIFSVVGKNRGGAGMSFLVFFLCLFSFGCLFWYMAEVARYNVALHNGILTKSQESFRFTIMFGSWFIAFVLAGIGRAFAKRSRVQIELLTALRDHRGRVA